MIPKIIHYCWFGGNPLPPKAKKCLKSWKKYFPAHEIKEWNETNYDVNKIPYTKGAYQAKKYAFVSDYARFDLLYQYGGLYFDTDVEVINCFDSILEKGQFLGMETTGRINPGIGCAFNTGETVLKEILETYHVLDFSHSAKNNITIVDICTDIFTRHGFQNNNTIQTIAGVNIYPTEYFNPVDFDTHYLRKTANTLSIHHGEASWVDGKRRTTAFIHRWLCRIFGKKTGAFLSSKIRKTSKKAYQHFKKNDE
jgi:mannosyltransferase OCH1-like enzyme